MLWSDEMPFQPKTAVVRPFAGCITEILCQLLSNGLSG